MKRRARSYLTAAFAVIGAVFASLTLSLNALAYEDLYAGNGNIEWIGNTGYPEGTYILSNSMDGTTSDVVVFMVTQPVHYIDQMPIRYAFNGKMNREDNVTHGFEVKIGMPIDHLTQDTIELGGREAYVKQAQFGIYPGYYNFYNTGENYVSYMGSEDYLVITLGPNGKLIESDEYRYWDTVPEDSFIEVQKGEAKRIYVAVGEVSYLATIMEDFETWAAETEAYYVGQSVNSGLGTEIDVDVPEENLEDLLQSAQPDVEIEEGSEETKETPAFQETKTEEVIEPKFKEEKSDSSINLLIPVVLVLVVVALFLVFLVRRKK